jgi:hypothetical protein
MEEDLLNLVSLPKHTLISLCKERGIHGFSKLNRFELIALLSIEEPAQEEEYIQEVHNQVEEVHVKDTNPPLWKGLLSVCIILLTLYNICYIRF